MNRKTLLIRGIHWAWRLIISLPVLFVLLVLWWYATATYERHTITRETARVRAIGLMEYLCNHRCTGYGIRAGELKGPIQFPIGRQDYDAVVKREEQDRRFEFGWQAPNGTELKIVVWDNGLYVDSQYWWDTPVARELPTVRDVAGDTALNY